MAHPVVGRIPAAFTVVVLAVGLFACIEGCGGSGPTPPPPNPQAQLGSTIDRLAQADMQQFGVPAMTVALAKNGTILYAQGYGVTDLATHNPVPATAILQIGSVTKQFTAALILKLQEQGKLHVDDFAATYLPQYNFAPNITIRMLLNHTSGLADFTNFPDFVSWVRNGISEQAALTEISQAGLDFAPGSKYEYSNSNFYLLGSIIEAVTGQSYESFLEHSIFQPLELRNTSYTLPPLNLTVTGYRLDGTNLVQALDWDRSAAFAAGALSANVQDLVAWDNALLSGKVVSAASFKQMTTGNGFFQNRFTYGFGLQLSTYNNRQIMWHNGQIGGFTAENAVFLDDGFTVVVLTSDQDYDTDQFVLKIFNAVCASQQLAGNC